MDIFERIIFVSFEQGGGGHRFARTIAALDCIYWYSHPDNGVQPWNIHFEHSNIRQRYAAKAHFDRIVPKGKLPPTWDYVSDFFPNPATYYGLFYKKFIEFAPDTDKKFLYCTHSTPGELRKFFPKSKIINIVNDVKSITDRYMQTTALFPGWVRFEGLVEENNEYLQFLNDIKKRKKDFTRRDIWAVKTHGELYNEDMYDEYYPYIYNITNMRMAERMEYYDFNTYRAVIRPNWLELKYFLLSQV